jgi:hypothetical protein
MSILGKNRDDYLISWALRRADDLNLKATKFTWVDSIYPEYTDFRVNIKIDGKNYQGRGTDVDKNKAFAKALTEAIERQVSTQIYQSKNGNDMPWTLCAHNSVANAREGAQRELLERDLFYFLNHYRISIKPYEIEIDSHLKSICEKTNVQIKQFLIPCAENYLAITASTHVDFDLITGLSLHPQIQSALKQSEFECLRNTWAAINGEIYPQNKTSQNRDYYFGHQNDSDFDFYYKKPAIETEIISPRAAILQKVPLAFVLSESLDVFSSSYLAKKPSRRNGSN